MALATREGRAQNSAKRVEGRLPKFRPIFRLI
jgi:hypothetical protein